MHIIFFRNWKDIWTVLKYLNCSKWDNVWFILWPHSCLYFNFLYQYSWRISLSYPLRWVTFLTFCIKSVENDRARCYSFVQKATWRRPYFKSLSGFWNVRRNRILKRENIWRLIFVCPSLKAKSSLKKGILDEQCTLNCKLRTRVTKQFPFWNCMQKLLWTFT